MANCGICGKPVCGICGKPVSGTEAYTMQGNKILVVHPACKPDRDAKLLRANRKRKRMRERAQSKV